MKQARSNAMLMLTALIWGAAFVAQSAGMDHVGAFTFNAARNLIGAAVLLPCIFLLDKAKGAPQKPQTPAQKRTLLLGGVCCGSALFVACSLQQFGIAHTTVGKAGFITALYILFVPLLCLVVFRRRVGAKLWGSVALAVVGMYLLCMTGSLRLGLGDALVLAASACFAVHILVIDYFSPKVDCVRMSCIQFFVCGAWSFLAMLVFEQPTFAALSAALLPIAYAGVLSCGVAYTLQVVAQKDTDPTVASLILSLESVFALLAGWVLLGETMNAKELFGCALVFVAILLSQLPDRRKASTEPQT